MLKFRIVTSPQFQAIVLAAPIAIETRGRQSLEFRRQPQDREGARPCRAAIDFAARRRGDRVIRRREVIAGLGSAITWPVVARAQQRPLPVIGFVYPGSATASADNVAAFRKGLGETGYVEGQNVTIEYNWLEEAAESIVEPSQRQYDRLPSLMADLVRRRVTVIVASSTPVASAARPQRSRSYSASVETRSSLGLSPASRGRVAMRRGSMLSPWRWWPSGWHSCMS
jgi:hypothetical protein